MKIAHTENIENGIMPGHIWNLFFKLIKMTIIRGENVIVDSGPFNAFYVFNYLATNN